MATKRIAGLAAAVAVAGLAVPLMAQQVQAPGQPTPVPPQVAPGVTQPAPPTEPGAPPAVKPPVIPRRVPVPGQPPGAIAPQGEAPGVPQAQPGAPLVPRETPAPQVAPAPGAPQRRFAAPPTPSAGGMVSLNFNRADLIEIIHIIAQQLRLTYTIDPDVKGSVTINSARPDRRNGTRNARTADAITPWDDDTPTGVPTNDSRRVAAAVPSTDGSYEPRGPR